MIRGEVEELLARRGRAQCNGKKYRFDPDEELSNEDLGLESYPWWVPVLIWFASGVCSVLALRWIVSEIFSTAFVW